MRPKNNMAIVAWAVASLLDGSNIRSDLGSEEELRRLGRSMAKGQDMPLLILEDGTVVDGHRRLAAARLEGIEKLYCIVVPPGLSPADIKLIQLRCATHRRDISLYNKLLAVSQIKAEFPNLTNKQLADDILEMDPAMLTKYLRIAAAPVEVLDAVKADRLTLNDAYDISRAADPLVALGAELNDSTPPNGDGRPNGNGKPHGGNADTPSAKPSPIRIPLATKTATGTVTVAETDTNNFDLVIALLKEAIKAVEHAKAEKCTAKTAKAMWKDQAKAARDTQATSRTPTPAETAN